MPSPRIIPLLPVFRPLVVASAISLLLLFTARTASSANQRTRSNSQTLAASSSNLSFGNIQLGNSLTQFETITNTGNATVTISQATVTGPGFGVRGLTLPTSLSKGQSVTFRVLCTPLDSGNMSGTIAVVSNGPHQALNIALSGNGVSAGQLTASASALDFGGVAVGSSKSMPATLTATGSSVTISSATSTSAEFSLSGISIPQTIARRQNRVTHDHIQAANHVAQPREPFLLAGTTRAVSGREFDRIRNRSVFISCGQSPLDPQHFGRGGLQHISRLCAGRPIHKDQSGSELPAQAMSIAPFKGERPTTTSAPPSNQADRKQIFKPDASGDTQPLG